MGWLKDYRIRKLNEYILELDSDIETIQATFKGVTEVSTYYIDKLIASKRLKAVFEYRLKNLIDA